MATVQVNFYGDILNVTGKAVKYVAIGLFRNLTNDDADLMIEHAKSMPEGIKVNPLWHPVVQDYLLTTGHGVE
jgi:hypothetical protein